MATTSIVISNKITVKGKRAKHPKRKPDFMTVTRKKKRKLSIAMTRHFGVLPCY